MTSAGRTNGIGRWGLVLPWPVLPDTDPAARRPADPGPGATDRGRAEAGVTGPVGTPVPGGHGPAVLPHLLELGRTAERLGFTSLWVDDDPSAALARADAYSVLGALATATEVVALGALPSPEATRFPGIVAKVVTTVDVLSGGRAVLGLAAHPAPEAVWPADLEESLRICRAVLDDEEPTLAGEVYSVAAPVNRPRPIAADGVPIAVRIAVSTLAAGDDGGRTGGGVGPDAASLLADRADLVLLELDRPGATTAVCRHLRTLAAGRGRPDREPTVLGLLTFPGGRHDATPAAGHGADRSWESLRITGDDGDLDGVLVDLSRITGPPHQLRELVTSLAADLALRPAAGEAPAREEPESGEGDPEAPPPV